MQGVHITLRMRLMCEVCRAGADEPEQTYEVMNEVVVDRGANPYLTKIECWEHGRLITKVRDPPVRRKPLRRRFGSDWLALLQKKLSGTAHAGFNVSCHKHRGACG